MSTWEKDKELEQSSSKPSIEKRESLLVMEQRLDDGSESLASGPILTDKLLQSDSVSFLCESKELADERGPRVGGWWCSYEGPADGATERGLKSSLE
jgi:hypothetical protein